MIYYYLLNRMKLNTCRFFPSADFKKRKAILCFQNRMPIFPKLKMLQNTRGKWGKGKSFWDDDFDRFHILFTVLTKSFVCSGMFSDTILERFSFSGKGKSEEKKVGQGHTIAREISVWQKEKKWKKEQLVKFNPFRILSFIFFPSLSYSQPNIYFPPFFFIKFCRSSRAKRERIGGDVFLLLVA